MSSEASIEGTCAKYAKWLGVPTFKLSGYIAGDPDRIFLLPGNTCLLVEFKKPGGRLSKRQEIRHAQLRDAGHEVAVVYSTQQFRKLLAGLLRLTVD